MADRYSELEVRIHSIGSESGRYHVEAELGNVPIGEGELSLDRQQLLLAEFDPIAYGRTLFDALLGGGMRDAYIQARERADEKTEGRLRIRLRIEQEAAELHALSWERICHVHRGQLAPLAASANTPFSRYPPVVGQVSSATAERPVRLLVAISNPSDLPEGLHPIDVRAEIENLNRALGDLSQADQLRVTILSGRTPLSPEWVSRLETQGYSVVQDRVERVASLENIVRLLPGHHVLHFIGHGHFSRSSEHGPGHAALYLERADGGWEAVRDERVTTLLGSVRPLPRLIFLAACESAAREAEGPFIGLGPKLVRAGIPAVVAMREQVPMAAAQQFANGFYRRLLEHGVVDRALNEARNLLFERESADWAIPVLFMHRGAGQLFASDPIRATLKAVQRWVDERLADTPRPMPLDVVHLSGSYDIGDLKHLGQDVGSTRSMLDSVCDVLCPEMVRRTPDLRKWVVLVGGRGMARTNQLYQLVRQRVEEQLERPMGAGSAPVLPLYVNLGDYASVRAGLYNPIEVLILAALKRFWPDLSVDTLNGLSQQESQLTLWVLLDGSDDLSASQRQEAWRWIGDLVDKHPEHAYLMTVYPDFFVARLLSKATDVLVIQPLSAPAIGAFLRGSGEPKGGRLLRALKQTRLLDLAGTPWLLGRMLQQAQNSVYPRSRIGFLEGLVEDATANMAIGNVMQSRAAQTLYALAYETKVERKVLLSVSDVFRVMAAVRGNREYSLEALYDELIKSGLLVRVGHDALRFAYAAYEEYCCARAIQGFDPAKRGRVLNDVVNSLGRVTRLRAWEETLVLLCGMMRDPNVLLRKLLYRASPGDAEQIFVAVRCLQESGQECVDERLREQMIDALIWLLSPDNVRDSTLRARAAQALGALQDPSALRYLVRAANGQERTGQDGKPGYEYGNVRLAATLALRRFGSGYRDDIRALDPKVADLLSSWSFVKVSILSEWLCSGDEGIGALAAFPLADLYLQNPRKGQVCLDILIDAFREAGGPRTMRWAVADALTLLDATMVTHRVILPVIDAQIAQTEGLIGSKVWRYRAGQYQHLAYLIGRIRAPDARARDFLCDLLTKDKRVYLKGQAIQALGELQDRSFTHVLENIANADFANIPLPKNVTAKDRAYLRRKAIEALAHIGDSETLDVLWSSRAGWTPRLRLAYYETSQTIVRRLEREGQLSSGQGELSEQGEA